VAGDARIRIGRLGERLAAQRLERDGYRIIQRNYRTREGEIDLVARRAETLVFCEVKTLVAREDATRGPSYLLEAIGAMKRAQVRRIARAWIAEHASANRRWRSARFDAIGVLLSPAGKLLRLEHVEGAF
jgi:putative endonuclease